MGVALSCQSVGAQKLGRRNERVGREDDKKNVDDECVQNHIAIIGEKTVTGRNEENRR